MKPIKGRNSDANLRKTTIYDTNIDLVNDDVYTKIGLIYNTNLDLVNDNVYTKCGLNRSIRFRDIEQNSILTSIKGRNSVANEPKFELIQAFMHVLDTCKNEEDPIKNEGARVFTRFLPL